MFNQPYSSSGLIPSTALLLSGEGEVDRNMADVGVGNPIPLVYGRDVYIPRATVLCKKIGISGDKKRLVQYAIALISGGQNPDDSHGEIVSIEKSTYSHGIRTGDSTFIDWRAGLNDQKEYNQFPLRVYSYNIVSREITIPEVLSNGAEVVNGRAFWRDNNASDWQSVYLFPGRKYQLPGWSKWVSIYTKENTAYPGLSTVLYEVQSPDGEFSPSDFRVTLGKSIPRVLATDDKNPSSAINIFSSGNSDGKVIVIEGVDEEITLDRVEQVSAENSLEKSFWYVYEIGNSDRFGDVLVELVRNSIQRHYYFLNFQDIVEANTHTDAQGLYFGGAIRDRVSINKFVNKYSMLFDLIPRTIDTRLGVIPHTKNTCPIKAIYSDSNVIEQVLRYLESSLHTRNDIFSTVLDPFGDGYYGSVYSVENNNNSVLSIDTSSVISDRTALNRQLQRINDSLDQQNVSMTLITDAWSNIVDPGDFILISSGDVSDERSYSGVIRYSGESVGITGMGNLWNVSNPRGIYTITLAHATSSDIVISETEFPIDVRVGDWATANIGSQDESGRVINKEVVGVVVGVSQIQLESSFYQAIIKLSFRKWVSDNYGWEEIDDGLVAPKGTEIKLHQLTMESEFVRFQDSRGNCYSQRGQLVLYKENEQNVYGIRFADSFDITGDSLPALIENNLKVWRVASVEPKPQVKSVRRGTASSLVHEINATIYPFAEPEFSSLITVEGVVGTFEELPSVEDDYPEYIFDTGYPADITASGLGLTAVPNVPVPTYPNSFTNNEVLASSTQDDFSNLPVLTEAQLQAKEDAVVNLSEHDGGISTGFFISTDGYFVTCEHVAVESDGKLTMKDGSEYQILWIGQDSGRDLAIGRVVDNSRVFPYFNLAHAAVIEPGDTVWAIGHPDRALWSFTSSEVENVREYCTPDNKSLCYRTVDGLLEKGSSGGPVIDNRGLVIGIARAIAIRDGEEKDYFVPVEILNDYTEGLNIEVPPAGEETALTSPETRGDYTRSQAIEALFSTMFSSDPADYKYTTEPDLLNKWDSGVITITANGLYSNQDVYNAVRKLQEVETYLNGQNYFNLVTDGSPGDIEIWVVPEEQFENIVTTAGYELKHPSLSWYEVDAQHEISKAYIILPGSGIAHEYRWRLLQREFLRVMGFVGGYNKYAGHIFNQDTLADSGVISPEEGAAIRTAYRLEMRPGITKGDAATTMRNIVLI